MSRPAGGERLTIAVLVVNAALEAFDRHQHIQLELTSQLTLVQPQQEAGYAAQIATQRCSSNNSTCEQTTTTSSSCEHSE